MTYRDNVTALAHKLGISNDPGLREEDMGITKLCFMNDAFEPSTIVATDMNRGGRLFFQDLATNGEERLTQMICDDKLRERAANHFAELWDPDPKIGKRKLLDAIRFSQSVEIIWK